MVITGKYREKVDEEGKFIYMERKE